MQIQKLKIKIAANEQILSPIFLFLSEVYRIYHFSIGFKKGNNYGFILFVFVSVQWKNCFNSIKKFRSEYELLYETITLIYQSVTASQTIVEVGALNLKVKPKYTLT